MSVEVLNHPGHGYPKDDNSCRTEELTSTNMDDNATQDDIFKKRMEYHLLGQ